MKQEIQANLAHNPPQIQEEARSRSKNKEQPKVGRMLKIKKLFRGRALTRRLGKIELDSQPDELIHHSAGTQPLTFSY